MNRLKLRAYYRLTKPGIVYGNAIAAIAGYFFAAHGHPEFMTFSAMLLGIMLVMASACVFNNVLDRNIDAKMERTKKRSVAAGQISVKNALVYASVLLLIGLALLIVGTNVLAASVALFGHFAYVVLYGVAKRKTVHGTLVGTISGSTPPVIGYVAVTGHFDIAAALLFILMAAWQMPHFFAIAIFRHDDYKAAGIPVLSVVKGMNETRRQIIMYVCLFIAACILLGLFGGASPMWILVMSLLAGYWLFLCLQPATSEHIVGWARKQFGWSLYILLIMSVMLSLDSFFSLAFV